MIFGPITTTFPPHPTSARRARALVRGAPHGYDGAVLDDVVLMVSELVTNAMQHALSGITVVLEAPRLDWRDEGLRADDVRARLGSSGTAPRTPVVACRAARAMARVAPSGSSLRVVSGPAGTIILSSPVAAISVMVTVPPSPGES